MPYTRVVDLLPQPQRLLLSEVMGSFSYSLDMAEGHTAGHSLRCCWLGVQIGKSLSLSAEQMWDLYYILLLKDIGGTRISSKLSLLFANDDRIIKHGLKVINTDNIVDRIKFIVSNTAVNTGFVNRTFRIVFLLLNSHYLVNEILRTRAERGADLVIQLGFNDSVADGIHSLNEHWDGNGHADGIKDHVIPVSSQIALISELFDTVYQDKGINAALDELNRRVSSWFNPELVDLVFRIFESKTNQALWTSFKLEAVLKETVYALEPVGTDVTIDDERLDDIATAFAQIVDSKSPYTQGHSTRVALYTDAIANEMGFSVERRRWLYRGSLLHDLGKMGLSNLVSDKKTSLSKVEQQQLMRHSRNTYQLLDHMQSFKELAKVASAHHEYLDGSGYPKGIFEPRISLETRIITVANIFDGLMTESATSNALPLANVLRIMEKKCDSEIDRDCFNALKIRIPDFFPS